MTAPIEVFAPGKLFVFGEWSVLRGGVALLTSVPAGQVGRAVVDARSHDFKYAAPHFQAGTRAWRWREGRWVSRGGDPPSFDPVGAVLEGFEGRSAPICGVHLHARPEGMHAEGSKLGFGSSATASVLTAWAMETCWRGSPPPLESPEILEAALAGHRRAQRGRGSGADVAVAALALRDRTVPYAPIAVRYAMGAGPGSESTARVTVPEDLRLLAAWTGVAADTRRLLESMERAVERDQRGVSDVMTELDNLSRRAIEAWREGQTSQVIEAADGATALLDNLGRLFGTPIVTTEHEQIRKIVAAAGGGDAAAKVSGAGGGDMAIIIVHEGATTKVKRALSGRGVLVTDLYPSEEG